jgi:hypothetical protein
MKHRQSRSFISAMVFLIAVGATGTWAWQKANSVDPITHLEKSFLQNVIHKREQRPISNRKSARELRIATEKLIAALKAEYPALASEERSVPDEENGFLQLFLLGEQTYESTEVSERLKRILNGDDEWDEEAAREALAENAALVEKIERIAAMKERSSSPPEYWGFIDARAGKYGTEILLLKARLAAGAGDENEALRLVRGAINIGNHYHDLETGSLLCETVAILVDLSIRSAIMKTILPTLGSAANPEAWKASMPALQYSSANLAKVLRGEWETSARHLLFPMILDPSNRDAANDGEALARAFAADYSDLVTEVKTIDFQQLQHLGDRDSEKFYAALSSESREFHSDLSIGVSAWTKGYKRAATVVTQHEVAINLMVLEESGILLGTSSASRFNADPVSGKPFIFDPATRTLTAPDSTVEVKPVVLP